jgi:cytoskeleton protein RodZ
MRLEAEVAELPTEPGSRLERQRALAGLTEQQVAERLNLDAAAVTALEREDYSALGAPVFVRGHLKRYAVLLGLDEDEILGAYERSRAHLSQPTLVPKSRAEMLPDRGPPKWPWLFGGVLLVLLAAAVVAYVGEYGLRLPKWPGAGAGTPAPAPTAIAKAKVAGSAERDASQSASSPPVAGERADSGATTDVAMEPGPTPGALGAGQVALQLRFAADSWVEIYDGSGKAVLYDLGKAGTDRVATGTAPLSVTLGNAPAVRLQVSGRAVSLPAPPAGQTVGRYTIGPDGTLR